MTNRLLTFSVLEHSPTRIVASYTTTSQGHSRSCFWWQCLFLCPLPLWVKWNVTPIMGLDDMSVFNAYKGYFNDLMAKVFKPKLNIMDNIHMVHQKKSYQKWLQTASCQTPQSSSECCRAHDTDIWSGLHCGVGNYRQHVSVTVVGQTYPTNLGHPQHVVRITNWSQSFGIWHFKWPVSYDWNQYPLAPLGWKAVVYKDGDTHGSWASQEWAHFISALQKIITNMTIITS